MFRHQTMAAILLTLFLFAIFIIGVTSEPTSESSVGHSSIEIPLSSSLLSGDDDDDHDDDAHDLKRRYYQPRYPGIPTRDPDNLHLLIMKTVQDTTSFSNPMARGVVGVGDYLCQMLAIPSVTPRYRSFAGFRTSNVPFRNPRANLFVAVEGLDYTMISGSVETFPLYMRESSASYILTRCLTGRSPENNGQPTYTSRLSLNHNADPRLRTVDSVVDKVIAETGGNATTVSVSSNLNLAYTGMPRQLHGPKSSFVFHWIARTYSFVSTTPENMGPFQNIELDLNRMLRSTHLARPGSYGYYIVQDDKAGSEEFVFNLGIAEEAALLGEVFFCLELAKLFNRSPELFTVSPTFINMAIDGLRAVRERHGRSSVQSSRFQRMLVTFFLPKINELISEAFSHDLMIQYFCMDNPDLLNDVALPDETGLSPSETYWEMHIAEGETALEINPEICEEVKKRLGAYGTDLDCTGTRRRSHNSLRTGIVRHRPTRRYRRSMDEKIKVSQTREDNYPVIFNIIFFMSIFLVLITAAVVHQLACIDPGRDGVIYARQKTE